jgi:putative transposase
MSGMPKRNGHRAARRIAERTRRGALSPRGRHPRGAGTGEIATNSSRRAGGGEDLAPSGRGGQDWQRPALRVTGRAGSPAPHHPQTQGKIERWHQTLKNRILLEHYYLPGDLEAQIDAFVAHYNHHRYHESLNNLTPADVCFGRGQTTLLQRERIKRNTIQHRRLQHQIAAA